MTLDRKVFFDGYRGKFDNHLSQKEVDAIDQFLTFFEADECKFELYEWAYIFATVYHETAHTFLPVIEAYWKSEEWRKRNFRYYPYYGRGYVQLTWEANYKKFGKLLQIDLAGNPELACEPETAWKILIIGCNRGLYTGAAIGKYVKHGSPDYVNMRRVINGNDKAELIASYAEGFRKILNECIIY